MGQVGPHGQPHGEAGQGHAPHHLLHRRSGEVGLHSRPKCEDNLL